MLYTESVKKQYDKYVVFNGVSVEIPSCSFVSLTGKNGIGKTMFFASTFSLFLQTSFTAAHQGFLRVAFH